MNLPSWTTQLPGRHQVKTLGFDDIRWNYGEAPTVQPHRFFGNGRAHQTKVEPAPAYAHEAALIEEMLEICHEIAPLCAPVSVNILGMVDGRGSNGWAQQQWEYYHCLTPKDCQCDVIDVDAEGKKTKRRSRNWDGVIVLSGRTTEIHPAVGRYVTVHEYGHIVEHALGLIRHDSDQAHDAGTKLLHEWAKVRRLPVESFDLPYGVTTHHLLPGEVFANDFRFAAGVETEWWPHQELVPALGSRGTKRAQRWWDDAFGQLADCYREAKKAEETG